MTLNTGDHLKADVVKTASSRALHWECLHRTCKHGGQICQPAPPVQACRRAGCKAACKVTFGQVVGKGQQGGAVAGAPGSRLAPAPEAQHGDLARGAAGVEGNRPRHVLQRDCLFAWHLG
jgi:hypothetical protein